jgi:4-amino-4-deoxy-L-arabinose transferase-like glycosyltransferase
VQPGRNSSRSLEVWLVLIILCLALALRVIHLDADPSALISRDFITDEGQWAHNVRNLLAYGTFQLDGYNPAYLAYLYHQLLRFEVNIFGLSLITARMPSVVFGWLTVVVLFFWVRFETNRRTAIFAITFLSVSNLHVLYSRTGFVESTMVFFLVLMLWLWSLREKHNAFAFLAGLALGLMILTKVTAIYIIPGLGLLGAAEAIRQTSTKRNTLMFLCGASLIGVGYAVGFVAPNFNDWFGFSLAAGLDNEFPTHLSDLASSLLRVMVWRFYARIPILTGLTLLALGSLIVRISSRGLKTAIRQTGSIEIVGLSLLIGYLFSIGLTVYQPERRFLPALLLMVVLSANVLDKGWAWVEEVGNGSTKLRAGGWFAVLFALPAIAIVEIKWSKGGAPLSFPVLMFKAAGVALLVIVTLAISRRKRASASPLQLRLLAGSKFIFVLLFSAFSLGLAYQALLLLGFRVLEVQSGNFAVPAVLILASAGAIVLTRRLKPSAAPLLLTGFILIEAVQLTSWLARPTYTLKEANNTLARLIGTGETVITPYETLLVSSNAKVICYWPKAGFNVDAFGRFNPDYILIMRRDNWKDYSYAEMPDDEWPPPPPRLPTWVARFDLCPTVSRGPRFSLELYHLN